MAKIGWQITSEKPDDLSGRAWRNAMKAGWFAVGMYHDAQVQPRKFDADAAQRYQYQPRSERYQKKKRRIAKVSWRVKDNGERELVYAGMTRTIVLRRQYPQAFPTRVKLDIPTPSYVQMRPRKANMPAMGVELTSITGDEKAEMEVVFVQAAEDFLQKTSDRRTRRI